MVLAIVGTIFKPCVSILTYCIIYMFCADLHGDIMFYGLCAILSVVTFFVFCILYFDFVVCFRMLDVWIVGFVDVGIVDL